MNRAQRARREAGFRSMQSRYAPQQRYIEFTWPFLSGSSGKDHYGTEYRRESSGQIRRIGAKVRDMRGNPSRAEMPDNLHERHVQGEGH